MYACIVAVFGFFNRTFTGIERNRSYHLDLGFLSGPIPNNVVVANVTISTLSASKFYSQHLSST